MFKKEKGQLILYNPASQELSCLNSIMASTVPCRGTDPGSIPGWGVSTSCLL
jgi:hypothetical protein